MPPGDMAGGPPAGVSCPAMKRAPTVDPRTTRLLTLVRQEITFEFARSSGPGGQHVNKVSTAATLCFDVPGSQALSEGEKGRVVEGLAGRISREGVLRVSSRRFRSQAANRKAAIERFEELLAMALRPPPRRVRTRTPRSAVERRLRQKQQRSRTKQARRAAQPDD